MVQVVIVLLQQRNNQLKIGLPWMEVYILPLKALWTLACHGIIIAKYIFGCYSVAPTAR